MKITIAANIYPPEIGGPAEYSRQLFETLLVQGHHTNVVTYGGLKKYSTGMRHFLYFCKLCYEAYDTEYVIAMDTYSVGWSAMWFAKLFRKKIVIRTGGDFLWETWSERTREPVLLSEFYSVKRKLSSKEKVIFRLTRFILKHVDRTVFSTEWQRNIMHKPYRLNLDKTVIIENFYSPVEARAIEPAQSFTEKIFLSPSRDRFIKNKKTLEAVFKDLAVTHSNIVLDTNIVSREVLREKISKAYAVIVPSISEVSPNLVLDALAYGVPAIVTRDTGIADRIKDMVVFVDPLSSDDIAHGVETLLDSAVYDARSQAIMSHTFTHSWNEIVQEFVDLFSKL
jgi:hypothetical protein